MRRGGGGRGEGGGGMRSNQCKKKWREQMIGW